MQKGEMLSTAFPLFACSQNLRWAADKVNARDLATWQSRDSSLSYLGSPAEGVEPGRIHRNS